MADLEKIHSQINSFKYLKKVRQLQATQLRKRDIFLSNYRFYPQFYSKNARVFSKLKMSKCNFIRGFCIPDHLKNFSVMIEIFLSVIGSY